MYTQVSDDSLLRTDQRAPLRGSGRSLRHYYSKLLTKPVLLSNRRGTKSLLSVPVAMASAS